MKYFLVVILLINSTAMAQTLNVRETGSLSGNGLDHETEVIEYKTPVPKPENRPAQFLPEIDDEVIVGVNRKLRSKNEQKSKK